jgi:hypothetical protein
VGTSTTPAFYYVDTRAGGPEVSAAALGVTTGTQVETIQPGPPAALQVTPTAATVDVKKTRVFAMVTTDAFGNSVAGPATWSVAPATLGQVTPRIGLSTTFTAGRRGGSGRLVATVAGAAGTVSGSATVTVRPGRVRVSSIRYGVGRTALLLTAKVVDGGGRPVAGALVSVLVRRNGFRYFAGSARTSLSGRATYRLRPIRGCYRTTVARVTAAGYRWNRATPPNRFCK